VELFNLKSISFGTIFMKSYLSIILILLCISEISAQNISLRTKWLVDDIPANTSQQNLNLLIPIAENWKIYSSYQYLFTDQQEFVGLPRIRTSIHSVENLLSINLRQWRLEFIAGGVMNIYPDETVIGDYRFGIRFSQPLITSYEGPALVMNLYGEVSRNREMSVATAIEKRISSEDITGSIDFAIQKIFTVMGKYTRQNYSDLNEKVNAYGAVLYHPFTDPWVALGYAYAYSNSLYNNWNFTNSVRTGLDPRTRQAVFEYSYFYNPYFTPIEEKGHLAIGVIQWGIMNHLAIYGKATVPFSSTGLQKYSPSTGNTPVPIDYNLYYELDGILPKQYEASIISDLMDPVTLRLNAEYFEKPYYSFYSFGLNMSLAF
jgi:hypothetical protein